MSAEFRVQDGLHSVSRGEFLASYEPYSIIVEPGNIAPELIGTPEGPFMVLDHHASTNRGVTLAAGEQALRRLPEYYRLFFRSPGQGPPEFAPTVYHDMLIDEDQAVAHHVLRHAREIMEGSDETYRRSLHQFVNLAGIMDATAGMYPNIDPRSEEMERMNYAFSPFTSMRRSGEIDHATADERLAVLAEMSGRIALVLAGRGERHPLDLGYEILDTGPVNEHKATSWMAIEETGQNGRVGAFRDHMPNGVETFVIIRQRSDEQRQITLCRLSEASGVDLETLYGIYNAMENRPPTDRWGGSPTVGGSPKADGTGLSNTQLRQGIEEARRKTQQGKV